MVKYYENERFEELSDELMKGEGVSDTVGGELVRAVNRICYRYYNDGDKIGCGYGNETCNAAGRYIAEYGDKEMKAIMNKLWDGQIRDTGDCMDDESYALLLSQLVEVTVNYLDSGAGELNNIPEDMFDFRSSEDTEYDIIEEDDDYYEDDDYDD